MIYILWITSANISPNTYLYRPLKKLVFGGMTKMKFFCPALCFGAEQWCIVSRFLAVTFLLGALLRCSVVSDSDPRAVAHQAPLSMRILQARRLEWVAMPSSGDLPNPGIKPRSPALQADSLPSEPPGKPKYYFDISLHEYFMISLTSIWYRLRHCAVWGGTLKCDWIKWLFKVYNYLI